MSGVEEMRKRDIANIIILILISLAVSIMLDWFGMVLPYLFGALITAVLYTKFISNDFKYPTWLQSVGLLIIGLEIGSSFRKDSLSELLDDAFNIVLITIFVVLLSIGLALIFKRLTGSTIETAILSSIPGALSQMLVMAEEDKRADLLLVTITQTSRIILVVVFVPFIASFFTENNGDPSAVMESIAPFTTLGPLSNAILIVVALIITYFLSKINFAAPIIIGPVLASVIWNFTTEIDFTMDMELMYAAQILFGIKIGIQIRSLITELNTKTMMAMLLHNVLLIIGTLIIVVIYMMFTTHNFNNLFLSAAPGGIGQIIIVASEMGSDIAMISTYHLFRIFFIILLVAPMVSWYLKWTRKKAERHN